MRKVTTLIIGAGQAGLAMSRELTARSIDHVILERGEVANSWRTERWDSLQLLTPNWMSGLPGSPYRGTDPDGFMSMAETAAAIERYAEEVSAPVETGTAVYSISRTQGGYLVQTGNGNWSARAVVLASGACNVANRPRWSDAITAGVMQLTPMDYRRPDDIDRGGVLIVGGSASGVQLAKEIHLAGRQVVLATGEHVRLPRRYRGRDIMQWMDACGIFDRRIEDEDDVRRARRVPSLQLVGGASDEAIDLNHLQSIGIRLAGRTMGYIDGRVQFSGALANVCALADLKMNRMLGEIDEWIEASGEGGHIEAACRFPPTAIPLSCPLSIDLQAEGIRTIIWATGYRPDYTWLNVPVLTPRGELRHDRGIVEAPGLYVLGLPFMRTRKSSFIAGVGGDAEALAAHLQLYLACGVRSAA